jgi:glycosyltransferase involved in cell wall biosynthesis
VSPPRHLALFIRSLDGGGGAERVMVTLAGAFAARGHRVDLVLGRARGGFLADVPPEVRVVDLGGGSWPATLALALRDASRARRLFPGSPPWILSCAPALVRYLRRERPEAMLSALDYSNLTALWARRLAGVPLRLVVSERNMLSLRAARGARRLRSLPDKVRRFYPEADALAAVSDGVAEDLARVLEACRAAVHTTYNPVVTPDLEERARERLDHPWLLPGEPPLLLAAGKLRPQKGFPPLLEACARLRAQRPARLLILGEGPERRRLEARVRALGLAGDVSLPGFQRNPFAFMARCGAFVLSSEWEGLPAVLIQAMACGAPVVATDCPSGPAEILGAGAWGPLVPVGDPEALAGAIARVLDAPPAPERLKARAGLFAAEPSAARYLDLLLGGPPVAPGQPGRPCRRKPPQSGPEIGRKGLGSDPGVR